MLTGDALERLESADSLVKAPLPGELALSILVDSEMGKEVARLSGQLSQTYLCWRSA